MEQFLSQLIQPEDIEKIKPGEFNVLRAPRGSGKTTFMFDDKILELARAKKHVLYLIQNTSTRDFIAARHNDKAKVFTDCNYNGWFSKRREKKGVWTAEEDEDFVHVMCYQTFAALLRNEGTDWLDDIDLIVWDEFDDIKGYYEKEVEKIKRVLPDFSSAQLVALLQEGSSRSIVNFIYQVKKFILEPAKLRLLAISATPECAALYFRDYINYILTGQLENYYEAEETIYINSVIEAIKDGTIGPAPGKRYWCYTRFITDGFAIENIARTRGFNTIFIWSNQNKNYAHLWTPEKTEALRMIEQEHRAPAQYDFIIVSPAVGRGVDIYDTSIQNWICNSVEYEDIGQFIRARFKPDVQFILNEGKGLVDFIQNGFAIDYYQWHTLEELRDLLEKKPIFTKEVRPKKLLTFNAIKNYYTDLFEQRRYGSKHIMQYRIKPAE